MGNRKKNPLDAEYTSGGIFNAKKLSILKQLRRQGIYRNPKTVLRVMQKYNLLSVVRRKKFHYCSQYLHRYPNLLNREFTVQRLNQKWATDISYIKLLNGSFAYPSSEICMITALLHTKWMKNKVLNWFSIRLKLQREKITTEL